MYQAVAEYMIPAAAESRGPEVENNVAHAACEACAASRPLLPTTSEMMDVEVWRMLRGGGGGATTAPGYGDLGIFAAWRSAATGVRTF